jgi:hypothetical protein
VAGGALDETTVCRTYAPEDLGKKAVFVGLAVNFPAKPFETISVALGAGRAVGPQRRLIEVHSRLSYLGTALSLDRD